MGKLRKNMASKLKMIKVQGITRRWLINIVAVIAVMFAVAFIVASVFVKDFYYSSVENIIGSGASPSVVNYFSMNLDKGSTLEAVAADFIESGTYNEKTTVWVIDSNANVVFSSSGFSVANQEIPDFNAALSSEEGTGKYVGRLSSGEKVMAFTRTIVNGDDAVEGAVRVMTSLSQVDSQIFTVCFLMAIIILAVLCIILYSNLFFINSIIIPVREITQTTQKIAKGDFSARIEKKYDDEIGDLCDGINSMAEDISETDKMKNDFISTISHELRTPLTSIKGWGETLLFGSEERMDELTGKGLQVIVSESGRLEGFVEELLDFSRLQSGRMNLRLAKVDVLAELEETLFTFRERAMREGIEVKYSIPNYPAVANADANRLTQVFMNILDNALKYSRAPSKIFVKATFEKKDDKDYVVVAVADKGCGISKEDLPHVKEKFYKANVSVRGSGIGLAVTNEIVTLHGGSLDIDSEQGRGTLVSISLPIEHAPAEEKIKEINDSE